MALRYNGITIGKMVIEQERGDETLRFPIQIRQGNCLAVFLFVRKSTPEELEKHPGGKWYHQLYSFLCDEQHCKNIMKNHGDIMCGEKVVSCELNLYYKECWTLLKYFTKSGYKVKCYYKEPKKK
jgi:hypothetical protein